MGRCGIFSVYLIKIFNDSRTEMVKVFGSYDFIICELHEVLNFVILHYFPLCCTLVEEISTKIPSIRRVMSPLLGRI
jgi:hypothetical protein